MISNTYFEFILENPLKTWWKARKYFKLPKLEIHFFKNLSENCPFASYNCVPKIFCIWSTDVLWKDKWNEPRHERDPYIWVCFFKKFGFSINFKIYYIDEDGKKRDGGMFYWEYLLDFLYYRKDINEVDTWWTSLDGKFIIPTKEFSLKHKYITGK